MSGVDLQVLGTKELTDRLQALPGALAQGALERAVLAGGKLIATAAAARAPVGATGKLKRSIGARVVEKTPARVVVAVGSRRVPYAHLVEFGHRLVRGGKLGKTGRVVGQVPARPFLRPAVDEQGQAAVTQTATVLREEIANAVAALGGKK